MTRIWTLKRDYHGSVTIGCVVVAPVGVETARIRKKGHNDEVTFKNCMNVNNQNCLWHEWGTDHDNGLDNTSKSKSMTNYIYNLPLSTIAPTKLQLRHDTQRSSKPICINNILAAQYPMIQHLLEKNTRTGYNESKFWCVGNVPTTKIYKISNQSKNSSQWPYRNAA